MVLGRVGESLRAQADNQGREDPDGTPNPWATRPSPTVVR